MTHDPEQRIAQLEPQVAGLRSATVASSMPVAAAGPLTTGSILNTATSATALTLVTSGSAGYGLGVADNGFGAMPPAVSGGGALFGHAKGNAVDSGVLGIAIGDSALAGVRGYADRTGTGVLGEGTMNAVVGKSLPTALEFAANKVSAGIQGFGGPPAGTPVPTDAIACGVLGVSLAGIGLIAIGGHGALLVQPLNSQAPPERTTEPFRKGVIEPDGDGGLWHCVADGTPGTWRQLSGPTTAGAFHPITPTRVYDSRAVQPVQGAIAAGQSRALSVAHGRDLVSGAITLSDVVPAGATAITCNVTVAGTVGSGFLTVNPGGVVSVSAATINWFASGQVLSNGVTLKIAGDRTVTVVAGGSGGATTDFIIDVTGYYR